MRWVVNIALTARILIIILSYSFVISLANVTTPTVLMVSIGDTVIIYLPSDEPFALFV